MSQAPELETVDVPPDTLAPRSPRASGPISVAEVPQPVYLTTQRASAETFSSFRFAAIFVASFGVTTFSVLVLYGGLLFLRPPVLVETPAPPAPPPPQIIEKPVPATPMVVAEPGDDEDESEADEEVAVASVDELEPAPVSRPRPRPRTTSPRVVRITQDSEDEAPEPAPEPEPEPEPEPPPPPPHPLSGTYAGKVDGEDVAVKVLLRADGTARFEIGGGTPVVATGVYTTRKADVLDFLVSARADGSRISWNGTVNKGKATGRISKDGQSAGRFAVSR